MNAKSIYDYCCDLALNNIEKVGELLCDPQFDHKDILLNSLADYDIEFTDDLLNKISGLITKNEKLSIVVPAAIALICGGRVAQEALYKQMQTMPKYFKNELCMFLSVYNVNTNN